MKIILKEVESLSEKDVHVVPNKNGGWDVKRPHAERASRHTETQKEAIEIGREIAKDSSSELFIHNGKGRIRDKNSYGNDPRKIKG